MKIRNGFVSNSSSSSFVIYKKDITDEQIDKILNVSDICEKMESQGTTDETFLYYSDDPWEITDTEHTIEGHTWMDNFSMYDYLTKFVGIKSINWR